MARDDAGRGRPPTRARVAEPDAAERPARQADEAFVNSTQ
jgi:hypothetical protein